MDVLFIADGETDYTKLTSIESGAFSTQAVTSNMTWYFRVLENEIIGEYTTTANPKQRVILDQDVLDAAGVPAAPKPEKDASGNGSLIPQSLPTSTFTKPPSEPAPLPPKSEAPLADVSVHGKLVDWFDAAPEAFAIATIKTKFLNVDENGLVGQVVSEKDNPAKTTATFLLQGVSGKKDTYRIQNVYYQDSYLYIDANAGENAPIRCGPDGKTLPTGEWIVKPDKYNQFKSLLNAAKPNLRIGAKENTVATSAKDYDRLPLPKEWATDPDLSDADKASMLAEYRNSAPYNAGDAFMLFDVKSYRALLGMVPALEKMAKNIETMEKEQKARRAAAEKAKQEEKARNEERRRVAAKPELVGGGGIGQENLGIRLGVGDVFQTKEGYNAIKYTFAPPGQARPYLTANLRTSDNPAENQFMDLYINPEVAAWVQNGDLLIGIDTGKETSINLRHGSKPSSGEPTDGNFFVGDVKINIMPWEFREVIIYPGVENKEVGFGLISDVTKGINVSAEEILGADISESKGTNVNFQAREYEVSGERGPADHPEFGSAQYQWDSCGIADKPKSTENCTYVSPVDLFDKGTLSLRDLPKIAQSMSGLETRSVFIDRMPGKGLSSRQMVNFDVHVQLHMVQLVRSTKENTQNKVWKDLKAGFTYVFRPDLWDFDKSFEDQHIIKEALYKPVGFTYDKTFRIWLWIEIDDLKPFMKD